MGKKRIYKKGADAIAAIHILWVLLLLGGALIVPFSPGYAGIQIGVLSVTLFVQVILFGNNCPLTLWEERLRKKINPYYTNGGSFMATYLDKIFGVNISVKKVKIATAAVFVFSYAIAILMLVR